MTVVASDQKCLKSQSEVVRVPSSLSPEFCNNNERRAMSYQK